MIQFFLSFLMYVFSQVMMDATHVQAKIALENSARRRGASFVHVEVHYITYITCSV